MLFRSRIFVFTICSLVASIRGADATTLVTNGGFESQAFMTTDPTGNEYRYVPGDVASITGWTFTTTGNGENSYLIAAGSNYGTVPEGAYALRLNVGDWISQSIVPPAPGSYAVSFATKGWQVGYNDLRMTIGGTSVVIPLGFNGTTQLAATLNGSTTLAIDWLPVAGEESNAAAEDFGGSGVVVDAISVTAVPEPSLGVVGLGGGAALAAIGRRCRGRSRLQ